MHLKEAAVRQDSCYHLRKVRCPYPYPHPHTLTLYTFQAPSTCGNRCMRSRPPLYPLLSMEHMNFITPSTGSTTLVGGVLTHTHTYGSMYHHISLCISCTHSLLGRLVVRYLPPITFDSKLSKAAMSRQVSKSYFIPRSYTIQHTHAPYTIRRTSFQVRRVFLTALADCPPYPQVGGEVTPLFKVLALLANIGVALLTYLMWGVVD
ncbi:hypothetical protein EON63_25180, partial [archaeon]